MLQSSGYLDLWRYELKTHPWRYDHAVMATMTEPDIQQDLRAYCIGTVQEAYSGGIRFAVNLEHYRRMHQLSPRQSWQLLIGLYETLVSNDHSRHEVARVWLARAYPADIELHMEKIEPHSDMWFSIVDRVDPSLEQRTFKWNRPAARIFCQDRGFRRSRTQTYGKSESRR